ncbi:MAG TPA: histidine--tRNA ligase [Anaerolineales bacterium]|nr:histidine--tRNA ligase [Anaerolineales bacterium]
MKSIIQPVQGTHDFYPEDMAIRTWLYGIMRSVAESFGYQEWEAPLIETLDLYAAKSGEELVEKQSYVLTDRDGHRITLRPELTPSLARMIAQRQERLTFPVRWWSFGPFWRHERTQKGRRREFFQWNVDMIGAQSPEADAENVAVLATFFRRVGLGPNRVIIYVNDRRLMNAKFQEFGIAQDLWPVASGWIDRKAKMSPEAWLAYGNELGLSAGQISRLQTVLGDSNLWQQSQELGRFFKAVDALGISDYVQYEPSIIRGLLYYTGTVFEAWEIAGDIKRSILGGGRYDNLMADVGGEALPAVGWAMGDVVMTLLLEKYGLLPKDLSPQPASVLVTAFDQERLLASYRIATELRKAGIATALYPEPAKLPKQFKYADKMGARVTLVIGPDEAAKGQVTVKDLASGTQQTLTQADVVAAVRQILVSPRAR